MIHGSKDSADKLCGNRRRYPDVYLASTFSSINNSALVLLPFSPSPASTLSPILSLFYSVSLFVSLCAPQLPLFDESSGLTRALLLSNGCPLFTRLRNSLCLYNGCLTRWVVFAIDRSSLAAPAILYVYCFSKSNQRVQFDRDSAEFLLSLLFRFFGPFVSSLTRPY